MKKFNLLLATTAILSTGLAICAMAVDEYDGPDTGTAVLKASAEFTSPIRAFASPVYFGLLDPAIGGDVTVEPNYSESTYEGAAAIGYGSTAPRSGYIALYGGAVSSNIDSGNVVQGDTGFIVFDDLSHKTITLIETGSVTQENPNGNICGTVTTFTEGGYILGNDHTYGDGYASALTIPIGATLSIKEGYQPSDSKVECEGQTTVTYMLNPDF